MPQLQKKSAQFKKLANLESSSPNDYKLGDENLVLNDIEGLWGNPMTSLKIDSILSPEEISELKQLFSGK